MQVCLLFISKWWPDSENMLSLERSQEIEVVENEHYHKLYRRRFFSEILCVPQVFMAYLYEVVTKPFRETVGDVKKNRKIPVRRVGQLHLK